MKQLVIGVVLAVLLVGCGEKPKFSITEKDTLETYANNPIFTKVESSETHDGETESNVAYQFSNAPASVYGIETGDLDVLGGTINIIDKKLNTNLTMKGKRNFDKLDKRVSNKKGIDCVKGGSGESKFFRCNNHIPNRLIINVYYNQFSDITSLTYLIL